MAPPGVLPQIDTGQANVIRMRTFSKAYGLAGLRVGYAIAPAELCTEYHKVRDHFGVNVMAQKAALAALADTDWLAQLTTPVRGRAQAYRADRGRQRARSDPLGDELRDARLRP